MAMTTVRRGLLGGVGALLPVSVSLLAVDLPKTFEQTSVLVLLGWVLKAGVLFFLGALVAGLHRDERSPIKLLELGVVAPALITTLVNGAQVDRNRVSALPALAAVAHAAAPDPPRSPRRARRHPGSSSCGACSAGGQPVRAPSRTRSPSPTASGSRAATSGTGTGRST